MADPYLLVYICIIFLTAGLTKGIVGGGLPVISIGLLTIVSTLPDAIAIAIIPAFVANIWQASRGDYFVALLKQLWPYLIASIVAVFLGTRLLIAVNPSVLTIVLGLVIFVYSFLGVAGKEFNIPAKREKVAAPVFGFLTGLIGGMTGSPAYPGLYFLNGLGFSRNQLVQSMGICFSVVTLSVAISMTSNELITRNNFILSIVATIPAMIGMIIGAKLRHKMSERMFKKLFYTSMLLLGTYLIARSLLRLA